MGWPCAWGMLEGYESRMETLELRGGRIPSRGATCGAAADAQAHVDLSVAVEWLLQPLELLKSRS